jgi:hypothetical protein
LLRAYCPVGPNRRPIVGPALWLVLMLSASCGGKAESNSRSAPSPSPISSSPANCRTYPSQYSIATNSRVPGVVTRGTGSCSFNRVTATLTCSSPATPTTVPGIGTISGPYPGDTIYRSVTDFVDEGLIAGRTLATMYRGTVPVFGQVVITLRYDNQSRLTGFTGTLDGSLFVTFSVSAWDTRGRPTRASVALPVPICGTQMNSISYDDTTRVATSTTTGCGAPITSATMYDTNGFPISQTSDTESGAQSVTYQVGSTFQVCK